MPTARDHVVAPQALAQVAGQVPAVLFQLRRDDQQAEYFPFASDRLIELTELTPAALREESGPFWALFGPDDATRARQQLEQSATQLTPWALDFQARLPSGRARWLTVRAAPVREADGGTLWHGVMFDATERRRTQQADKMEAIGRLAGGVAHDLNNLLAAVSGNIDVALIELPTNHPTRDSLLRSRQAAERAAELTRQLLAVGQRQVVRLDIVRWNDVVTRAADAGRLPVAGRPELTLEFRLDAEVPPVYADRSLLEQVLMYLLANAADAMPERGAITIATGRRAISEAETSQFPGMRSGDYAWLAVRDTGAGFDGNAQLHLFEPFFATEVVDGRRGGLGLSTVYGIVKQLDGYVYADSVPGVGTTFTVFLPVASPGAAAPAIERRRRSRAGGLVLVAEDEESVREPVRRVLQRLGYRVLDAPDGPAALAAAAECQEPIDLLLTDIVMPGMSGSELARQLRELHPDVQVIFMSGYSGEAIAMHGMLAPGSSFLPKPFTVTELMARIHEMTDRIVL